MAESTKVCLYNSHGDSFLKALLVVVASQLRRLAACMHPKILTPEISICSRCQRISISGSCTLVQLYYSHNMKFPANLVYPVLEGHDSSM